MTMMISNVSIEVQKKKIKNAHLYVKPPDGQVVVSVPLTMADKAIELFVRTNIGWVKRQIRAFRQQLRSAEKQYVSGETLYFWGKQYFLTFVPNERRNSLVLEGSRAVLSMRAESTVKQRESYVREQYRQQLKEAVGRLLPKWEKETGLRAAEWRTKYMTTKWGVCKPERKRLWFNLQLAEKPVVCLEYVILHELLHLAERQHNARFIALLDKHMPHWRELRGDLNELRLDYFAAGQ